MPKRHWNERFAYFITGWPKQHLQQVTWWHVARVITSGCLIVVLLFTAAFAIIGGWNGLSLLRQETVEAYREEKERSKAHQDQAARG